MTEYNINEYDVKFLGESLMSSPVEPKLYTSPVAAELSGIAINQNGELTGTISLENEEIIWQTFRFPADYPRGVTGGEPDDVVIPKLCGFQINVEVEINKAPVAGINWFIDYYNQPEVDKPGRGWIGIAKGNHVGSPADGPNAWFQVNFEPVDITDFWWQKFRIGIFGREGNPDIFKEPIPYDGVNIVINNKTIPVVPNISPTPLVEGETYSFEFEEEKPGFIDYFEGEVLYSEQQGVQGVIYTSPNPFKEANSVEYVSANAQAVEASALELKELQESIPFAIPIKEENEIVTIPRIVGSEIKAYKSDGVTPIISKGKEVSLEEVSLRFRVMSMAPDTDTDCTGSIYRTVALLKEPESIRTSVGELESAYWLSEPNPSQFACEALYLDISEEGQPSVVDHILIDPATPGIWMNVYFSNDPVPGNSTATWDALLWEKVDKQFLLRRKETFAFPNPITAKYIKLEFTALQPVWYPAGTFQLPTTYRKHPAWVMDYYLALYQYVRSQELEAASSVNVTYNILELAYSYYLDDIRQNNPNAPATVESAEGISLLTSFLTKEQEAEVSQIDPTTLFQINTSLQPYISQPAQQGGFGSLLQKVVSATLPSNTNYPTEVSVNPQANLSQISSLDRDSLIIEKGFPVTSFYLTCRHYYLIAEAAFEEERAYFAGIKEVTLTRDHYSTRYDTELYIESAGDNLNVESNDFYQNSNTWKTYSTTEI